MEKQIVYNREEYIKNYQLTRNEYFLLGPNEKLEYCHRLYGNLLEKLPNIDNSCSIKGIIPYYFHIYFKRRGFITYEEEDLGSKGVKTIIVHRKHELWKPSEIYSNKLDNYINEVANAKANVIEYLLIKYFNSLVTTIENGESLVYNPEEVEKIITTFEGDELTKVPLDKDMQDVLLKSVLGPVISEMENGEEVSIGGSDALRSQYCVFLRSHGYDAAFNSTNIVAKKNTYRS